MDRPDLESIKDSVYELEGLLELAELREDKIEALLPLMKQKLDIINSLFNVSLPAEVLEYENEDSVIEHEEDNDEEEMESTTATEGEYVVEEEDDDTDDVEDTVESEDSETIFETEPLADTVESLTDDVDIEYETGTPEKTTMFVTDPNAPKPAFCVNDRFRFKRELFNNSDSEFDRTMDIVATMENYEEAEQYFFGELGWNSEDESVVDFMAIISSYFDH